MNPNTVLDILGLSLISQFFFLRYFAGVDEDILRKTKIKSQNNLKKTAGRLVTFYHSLTGSRKSEIFDSGKKTCGKHWYKINAP